MKKLSLLVAVIAMLSGCAYPGGPVLPDENPAPDLPSFVNPPGFIPMSPERPVK